MIWIICLLLILPFLLGLVVRSKASAYAETPGMIYTVGFLFLFVLFGILYFPCLLAGAPLHLLSDLFLIVCGVLTGLSLLLLLRQKKQEQNRQQEQKKQQEQHNPLASWKTQETAVKILWIAAIALIAFQLFRVVVLQPYEYRDDKTYLAMVNDMVFHDSIYGTDDLTGRLLQPGETVALKYRMSAWMPFEAALSKIAGCHPLLLCRTILPGILLFCHFAAMDWLGKWLFPGNEKGRSLFLLVVAVLDHTTGIALDQTLMLMHWPAWGKSIVATLVIPLILVLMLKLEQGEKKFPGIFLLVVVTATGMLVSPMGYLIPPIEIAILALVMLIRKKGRKRHGDAATGI